MTWARLAVSGVIAYSRKSLAIFNVEGYSVTEKPKRLPAEDDVVGKELKKLLKTCPCKGLKLYNALWHKMRSSVYLRLNMPQKSIYEAVIALSYDPFSYKLYAYILLNLLPKKIRPI